MYPSMKLVHNLCGLVLVGGKSSRMGEAKAHVILSDQPLWRVQQKTLQACCREVFFSSSPLLTPPLSVSQDVVIDDVFYPPIGPLGGVLSAMKKHPTWSWFVLACDLPFFDNDATQFLLAHRDRGKKATIFERNGNLEPLAGIYEPTIFEDLTNAWAKGALCLQKILASLDVARIQAPEVRWLTNMNHAHEKLMLESQKGTMLVRTLYYASLREKACRNEEEVMTSASTVADLFFELAKRYDWQMDIRSVRFAKHDQLVDAGAILSANDVVVFIPPVSGG
jgi:molybdenum cofactor guanylyltransferase